MFRILIFVFLLTLPWSLYADTLTGRVVKVTDGDTINILDARNTHHHIRLQGVDAPERKQLYGKKSGKYLSEAVTGCDLSAK